MPHDRPQHWLTRAAEARYQAKLMTDARARQSLLKIAEGYERMAHRAEARFFGAQLRALVDALTSSRLSPTSYFDTTLPDSEQRD